MKNNKYLNVSTNPEFLQLLAETTAVLVETSKFCWN